MPKVLLLTLGFFLISGQLCLSQSKDPGVDRIPLFPKCKPRTMEKDLACFQKNIEKHISRNFNYPKQALEENIHGVVYMMMTITEDGGIRDIRTRGPHPILEAEAVRIMELLPKFQPALKDGKAVSIPYSIPITFKINSSSTRTSRFRKPEDPFSDFDRNKPYVPFKNR